MDIEIKVFYKLYLSAYTILLKNFLTTNKNKKLSSFLGCIKTGSTQL